MNKAHTHRHESRRLITWCLFTVAKTKRMTVTTTTTVNCSNNFFVLLNFELCSESVWICVLYETETENSLCVYQALPSKIALTYRTFERLTRSLCVCISMLVISFRSFFSEYTTNICFDFFYFFFFIFLSHDKQQQFNSLSLFLVHTHSSSFDSSAAIFLSFVLSFWHYVYYRSYHRTWHTRMLLCQQKEPLQSSSRWYTDTHTHMLSW